MNLGQIRDRIDEIDEKLAALLEERLKIVKDVATYKIENNMQVHDAKREEKVVQNALAGLGDKNLAPYIDETYRHIMGASRHMQDDMIAKSNQRATNNIIKKAQAIAGYMGVPGSYSEQSVIDYYGADCRHRGYPLFSDVVNALLAGEIGSALLPIENSSTGCINEVVDLIRENDVHIAGEQIVRVRHNLLSLPGADLDTIETVYSHPQGLEQSAIFLRSKGFLLKTSLNTAVAAEQVSKSGDITAAAVASARAAELYGLKILSPDIQDNDCNFTRFVVLSNDNTIPEDANKISLVFTLDHRPGTLYAALNSFADAGVNLTNLASRPIWSQAWHYFFHLDFTGRLDDERVKKAIEKLSFNCNYLKVLGNYRAASLEDLG